MGSKLLTIQSVAGAGPGYTLTVVDSTGVVTADHVVAPLLSDSTHGGIYRVTGVPTGTSINIQDDLVPGGGTYGAPTSGSGASWTPVASGLSDSKANNTPFWGDIVERDHLLLDAGAGHLAWNEDEFVPTFGQVTFILSQPPIDLASLEFYVNGVLYDDVTDYTVSGTTITWLNPFVLKTKDKVIIRYQ
jgi:hypothetical protein